MIRPLLFVLPHAIFFWAACAWVFPAERKIVNEAKKAAKQEGSKDAGSIQVITTTGPIAMFLGFVLAWLKLGAIAPGARIPMYYAGVALIVGAGILRRLCFRALGEYFTGDVRAEAGQPVIQTGPYRWIRHPSYTAGIMMAVGIGLAFTNWIALLLISVVTVAAYMYRVKVEERALLSEIGTPYAEFMRTRKRFIPYIV